MAQRDALRAFEKQKQALSLALAGVSYQTIAERVGYRSKQAAWKAVRSALHKSIAKTVEEERLVQSERLNVMLKAVWPGVMDGQLKAIETALRIEERRARLWGLDAPLKTSARERVTVRFVPEWDDDGDDGGVPLSPPEAA